MNDMIIYFKIKKNFNEIKLKEFYLLSGNLAENKRIHVFIRTLFMRNKTLTFGTLSLSAHKANWNCLEDEYIYVFIKTFFIRNPPCKFSKETEHSVNLDQIGPKIPFLHKSLKNGPHISYQKNI